MSTRKTEWSENPFVGDNVNADNGSSVSFFKKIVSGTSKDFLLGLFIAIAIIEGAFLWTQWHHKEQQSDLALYELHDFQTTHFNPLAAQVKSDHDLIQAYGLNKIVAETCKR